MYFLRKITEKGDGKYFFPVIITQIITLKRKNLSNWLNYWGLILPIVAPVGIEPTFKV